MYLFTIQFLPNLSELAIIFISRASPSTIQFFPNLSELVIIFIIWATPSEIWNKDKKEGALGVGNICLNTLFQRIEYEYSTIILES